MYGDCLELMRTLPDGCVDMVLTDPPYHATKQKWDKMLDWPAIWQELSRVCKPTSAKLFFAVNKFTIELCASNLKEYRYRYVWQKTSPTNVLNCRKMPMRKYEDICVFFQKRGTYNPQMGTGPAYNRKPCIKRENLWGTVNSKWATCIAPEELEKLGISPDDNKQYNYMFMPRREGIAERFPTDILTFKPVHNFAKDRLHRNQKPVDLLEFLIKTYTNKGETVLDFTMGSGSSGVACLNTGRNFIGMELDADMFTIAKQRIEGCSGAGKEI